MMLAKRGGGGSLVKKKNTGWGEGGPEGKQAETKDGKAVRNREYTSKTKKEKATNRGH